MKMQASFVAGVLLALALAPVVSSARDTHRADVSPEPAAQGLATSEAVPEIAGDEAGEPEAPLWRKPKHRPAGFHARFFAE